MNSFDGAESPQGNRFGHGGSTHPVHSPASRGELQWFEMLVAVPDDDGVIQREEAAPGRKPAQDDTIQNLAAHAASSPAVLEVRRGWGNYERSERWYSQPIR